jgi:CDP-diacylglycerol---serine O-phosphatidyltransferase
MFKGVLNWPNFISFIALITTFLAIVVLMRGNFYLSFSLTLVVFMLDFFDGYLARKLNQESDFGKQLDGFVDVFNYVFYPLIAFLIYFHLDDVFSIIILALFVFSGVFRLSKFNLCGLYKDKSGSYYTGLPVVFSHVCLIILIILKFLNVFHLILLADFIIFICAILMMGDFKFPKPKNIYPIVSLIFVIALIFFYLGYHGIN